MKQYRVSFPGFALCAIAAVWMGCSTTVTPPANAPIIVVPATIEFGMVHVGLASDTTIRFSNSGTAQLKITSQTFSSKQFMLVDPTQASLQIDAGGNQDVRFRFMPADSGNILAYDTIQSNAGTTIVKLHAGGIALTTWYVQTNLLADTAGFGATKIDVRLGNAWGIGIDPSNGNMEVGVNHDSAIFVCDRNGTVMRVIAIPKPDGTTGGSPTGVVHNSTSDFGGNTVITATEDGAIIAAGAAGDGKVVSDQSATAAVYKSIAMGSSGGASYIYAANFGKNSVDMFDKNFALHKQFTDPATPANFSAFGVGVFNNYLFVTFARWKVGHHDDSADAGIGFVDEFTLDGTFIKRFIDNGGLLNSPFGLALAGAGFGTFKNALLVGNFGDGRITGYDATTGALIGQLTDKSGTPLTIEGRWGITFNTAGGGDPNFLYYAAGPSGENLGVFGYVQLK